MLPKTFDVSDFRLLWPYSSDVVTVGAFVYYFLKRPRGVAVAIADESVEMFGLESVCRGRYDQLVFSITERLCIERMRRAVRLCCLASLTGVFGLTFDTGRAVRASALFALWLIVFFVTSDDSALSVRSTESRKRRRSLALTFAVYVIITLFVKSALL